MGLRMPGWAVRPAAGIFRFTTAPTDSGRARMRPGMAVKYLIVTEGQKTNPAVEIAQTEWEDIARIGGFRGRRIEGKRRG